MHGPYFITSSYCTFRKYRVFSVLFWDSIHTLTRLIWSLNSKRIKRNGNSHEWIDFLNWNTHLICAQCLIPVENSLIRKRSVRVFPVNRKNIGYKLPEHHTGTVSLHSIHAFINAEEDFCGLNSHNFGIFIPELSNPTRSIQCPQTSTYLLSTPKPRQCFQVVFQANTSRNLCTKAFHWHHSKLQLVQLDNAKFQLCVDEMFFRKFVVFALRELREAGVFYIAAHLWLTDQRCVAHTTSSFLYVQIFIPRYQYKRSRYSRGSTKESYSLYDSVRCFVGGACSD